METTINSEKLIDMIAHKLIAKDVDNEILPKDSIIYQGDEVLYSTDAYPIYEHYVDEVKFLIHKCKIA